MNRKVDSIPIKVYFRDATVLVIKLSALAKVTDLHRMVVAKIRGLKSNSKPLKDNDVLLTHFALYLVLGENCVEHLIPPTETIWSITEQIKTPSDHIEFGRLIYRISSSNQHNPTANQPIPQNIAPGSSTRQHSSKHYTSSDDESSRLPSHSHSSTFSNLQSLPESDKLKLSTSNLNSSQNTISDDSGTTSPRFSLSSPPTSPRGTTVNSQSIHASSSPQLSGNSIPPPRFSSAPSKYHSASHPANLGAYHIHTEFLTSTSLTRIESPQLGIQLSGRNDSTEIWAEFLESSHIVASCPLFKPRDNFDLMYLAALHFFVYYAQSPETFTQSKSKKSIGDDSSKSGKSSKSSRTTTSEITSPTSSKTKKRDSSDKKSPSSSSREDRHMDIGFVSAGSSTPSLSPTSLSTSLSTSSSLQDDESNRIIRKHLKKNILAFFPQRFMASLKPNEVEEGIFSLFLERKSKMPSSQEIMQEYSRFLQKSWRFYGTRIFYDIKRDTSNPLFSTSVKTFLLIVNEDGVLILKKDTESMVAMYPWNNLVHWTTKGNVLTLECVVEEQIVSGISGTSGIIQSGLSSPISEGHSTQSVTISTSTTHVSYYTNQAETISAIMSAYIDKHTASIFKRSEFMRDIPSPRVFVTTEFNSNSNSNNVSHSSSPQPTPAKSPASPIPSNLSESRSLNVSVDGSSSELVIDRLDHSSSNESEDCPIAPINSTHTSSSAGSIANQTENLINLHSSEGIEIQSSSPKRTRSPSLGTRSLQSKSAHPSRHRDGYTSSGQNKSATSNSRPYPLSIDDLRSRIDALSKKTHTDGPRRRRKQKVSPTAISSPNSVQINSARGDDSGSRTGDDSSTSGWESNKGSESDRDKVFISSSDVCPPADVSSEGED